MPGGVTRAVLLEIGAARGRAGGGAHIAARGFYAAEEMFLSSTNRNLLAVGEIAGRKIAAAPGPIVAKLDQVFSSYVRDYIHSHSASAYTPR